MGSAHATLKAKDQKMKMTDVERLTLIRMHEILAVLKPDEAKQHDLAIDILRDGYHEFLYGDEVGGHLAKPFSERDKTFVYDVLDLFRGLQDSYGRLSKAEAKSIDKDRLEFPGFDGNNEVEHLSFVKFLIKKQERWSDLDRKGGFNSHMPMIDVYSRMLERAKSIPATKNNLSAAEIEQILDARVHPSHKK